MSFSIDEKFSVLDISQRETLRTTWPSTSELRCSWRWENPNLPCQTWPEPSSSSLISWLWVHLITTRKTDSRKKKILIFVSMCSLYLYHIIPSFYVPALSGPVAEREHPFKAGQHAGGQGGLWSSGKLKSKSLLLSLFKCFAWNIPGNACLFFFSCSAPQTMKKLRSSWWEQTSWRSCRRRRMLHTTKGTIALPSPCSRESLRCVSALGWSMVWFWQLRLAFQALMKKYELKWRSIIAFCCEAELVCTLFSPPDLSLGSWVAGASCRMLHPNGGSTESHPGSDTDHKATQWQPCCLPEA